METIEARIEDASIHKISDLWRKKPRGLQFNDTDALIITAKTDDGKIIRETFYFCLKPDGTFDADTVSHRSRGRRARLAAFLKHYKITDAVRGYDVREGIRKWKGKNVEVVPYEGGGFIHIP